MTGPKLLQAGVLHFEERKGPWARRCRHLQTLEKARRQTLVQKEWSPACTWILEFWPPEPEENKVEELFLSRWVVAICYSSNSKLTLNPILTRYEVFVEWKIAGEAEPQRCSFHVKSVPEWALIYSPHLLSLCWDEDHLLPFDSWGRILTRMEQFWLRAVSTNSCSFVVKCY